MRSFSCALRAAATALSSPSASISSALRSITSAASRALDGLDERAVDQPEPEIGAAVPHRERRGLDQMGERVERAFRLAQAERQLRPLFFAGAIVDEPQQHGTRRLAPRRRPAAHVEHAARALRADVARQSPGRRARGVDFGDEGLEIVGGNAAILAGQLGQRRRPLTPARARAAAARRPRSSRRPGPATAARA